MAFNIRHWLEERFPGGRETGSGWYRASCPFHSERTPSFAVKVSSGNWGCKAASCGKHGGLIRLVAQVDKITWKEAYKLTNTPNPFDIDADFDVDVKEKPRPSRNGLPRGVVQVSQTRFPAYLAERGYGLPDAESFGLYFGDDLCEKEFRGHLLFPFWDAQGVYKTFTARQMWEGGNRYQQPDLSVVSSSLYGVWRFLTAQDVKRIFVVEGQFDVMRMWQLGLPAVGISTAATTPSQRRQLSALSRLFNAPVSVLLDRGENEAASAKNIAGMLSIQGVSAYSIEIPQDVKDPDLLTALHVPIVLDKCHSAEVQFAPKGNYDTH